MTQRTLDNAVAQTPMGYRPEPFIQWEKMPVRQLFECPYCNYSSRKNKKGSAFIKKFPDGNAWFTCFFCGKKFVIFDEWWGDKRK